ncbi:ENR1 protein, partial [Scytalopus superciliaris]|nr:ENR1 protein [Scytalopus superciliaris]
NPFKEIPYLENFWTHINSTNLNWKAPEGLFWICGKKAYTQLPIDWRGSCTLGTIQPGFFLLPLQEGKTLGITP